MNNLPKILIGLIYSAVLLLLMGVGIIGKIYIWDKEANNNKLLEDEVSYCGGNIYSSNDYLVGVKLNQTGESLFKNNCAACHAIHEVVVGPALVNVTERRKPEWIHKFVQNSTALIKAGDKEAIIFK